MANHLEKNEPSKSSEFSDSEKLDINNKVEFEINKTHYGMLKLGAIANILSGIVVGLILYYGKANPTVLMVWYLSLLFFSLLDIAWANHFEAEHITLEDLRIWRKYFYFILAAICLTWGSIGIFFITTNAQYELYAMTFLQVVVIGFTFSTATDFIIATISICSLLVPTIVFRFYLGIQALSTMGHDPALNFAFSITLFILGAFLIAASSIGSRMVKKYFSLTYANVALSKKLENMNKFLEQRVKERTIELENSLRLVTYQASHDLLTDLPNQRLLLEYIQTAIESVNNNKHMFAVAFFSINEIEKINNGLGLMAGDLVIKTVAQRLQQGFVNHPSQDLQNIRMTVTLSRKDIFVILIEPLWEIKHVQKITQHLFSVLDDPIYFEKNTLKITASVGVSLYPRDGLDAKLLMMNADAAMMHARKQGGNTIHIYTSEINENINTQLMMGSHLHSAVQNKEFILQYQPFVNAKTGMICGMEALIRWQHPTLGLVAPNSFISIAESNGLIIPIGDWILRTACAQTKKWHDKGFTSLKLAINLSEKQLHAKNIVQTLADILKETELNPACLELELTETIAFQKNVISIIKKFKDMGLSISMDDFGTGYSGLSMLKLFTIDKLKIDASFVRDLETNRDSKAIIENTIHLAQKIHVQVLAEGVETKEQLAILQKYGCHMIQGYYFSRAVDANAFSELLERNFVIS